MQVETGGTTFSPLPPYITLRKSKEKPIKDSKDENFDTFTLLLPKKVPFTGELLGKIPQLKFTDYGFNDRKKYP